MKTTRLSLLLLTVAVVAGCATFTKKEPAPDEHVADGHIERRGILGDPTFVPNATPQATAAFHATPVPVLAAQPNPDVYPDGLTPPNGKPYGDMYFKNFGTNPTIDTDEEDTSTFSIDVDTASYSVARSYLNRGTMPDEDAVRVEEFVNSFDYDYKSPDEQTFSVQVEAFPSPNRKGYHVLHVGLKGREVAKADRKPATLVFVIDVSGSMDMENRLGAVKKALGMLVGELDERDQVGIVVYGSSARAILHPTPATKSGKNEILEAIGRLRAEGSTNVQDGISVGYKMLSKNLRKDASNRIVLCSDGVANNGITGADAIFKTVKKEAEQGITISTVGFGMGNYNDVLMERLADIGDGNYSYVDSMDAAKKIFVDELTGTLEVIAKDVKIQMVFDPKQVARYRLLGFENRRLEKHEFDDDRVDAGEIGAGHTVTAMYEVKFTSGQVPKTGEFAQLRIRHKMPEGGASNLIEKSLPYGIVKADYASASSPTKLSMCSAAFAEKLRGSYWARNLSWDDLIGMWEQIPDSLRRRDDVKELGHLIQVAKGLDHRTDKFEKVAPVASMDFDNVPVLE